MKRTCKKVEITIFDNDTPVQAAERIFFALTELGVNVREVNSDNDSMTFEFSHAELLEDDD